jgi:beta-1,4-galactosyltransferase 1
MWQRGRHRLAVIVPYRAREMHLAELLPALRARLARQRIEHDIFVVEQADREQPFNRGKLFNIGVTRTTDQDYYCFHDVDMLPEQDHCDYRYVSVPTHLSAYCSQFDYKLPYEGILGGVTLFNVPDFIRVNGFSNCYWGWGGEDDDLRLRCQQRGLRVRRRPGRYTSLPHAPQRKHEPLYQQNLRRLDQMRAQRLEAELDGYSTLADYELVSDVEADGYRHVLARLR